MENNKNKVEVLISQERYDELLERERQALANEHIFNVSIHYLDFSTWGRTFDREEDELKVRFYQGDNVPEPFKQRISEMINTITNNINKANEERLFKIDRAEADIKVYESEANQKLDKIPNWIKKIYNAT